MGDYKLESDFTHKDLRCVVIMTSMGHRCGYIGIPIGHPLYGKDYSDKSEYLFMKNLENKPIGKRSPMTLLSMAFSEETENARVDYYFDVHGGITYAGSGECGYPVKSDLWWFGYDCAHAGDAKDLSLIESESLRETYSGFNNGVVRSLNYCINECKDLAEQLSKISK